MKINIREIARFQIISMIVIILGCIFSYYLFFENINNSSIIPKYPTMGIAYVINLFKHNMSAYVATIALFFIAPVPILFNWGVLIFIIDYNIGAFGIEKTIELLLLHGAVEIPTILLYQYLSLKMMQILYHEKSVQNLYIFLGITIYYFCCVYC